MDNATGPSMRGVLVRILKEVTKSKRTVFVIVGLSVIAAALDIVVPIITQKITDALVESIKSGIPLPIGYLVAGGAGILLVTLISRKLTSENNYKLFEHTTTTEDG